MTKEFVTFQLLHNRQIAEEIGSILHQEGIGYEIVENKRYFDPSFAFNKVDPEINLKLAADDFIKARNVLERVYAKQLSEVDPGYYLFKFKDDELLEIIRRPDEWGIFDHALAKRILSDRGIAVPDEAASEVMSARLQELRKPESVEPLWIGLGYMLALAGGFFGILMGWLFSNMKKTLPNGERVFVYNDADRRHGRRILKLGLIVFFIFMVRMLITSFDRSVL
ncbi:MAG TPA: hypothetical protein VLA58_01455 [Chitinophagaceae bacterium]|nr:hypothetical protein [Chitinophagaceae bacterium]